MPEPMTTKSVVWSLGPWRSIVLGGAAGAFSAGLSMSTACGVQRARRDAARFRSDRLDPRMTTVLLVCILAGSYDEWTRMAKTGSAEQDSLVMVRTEKRHA